MLKESTKTSIPQTKAAVIIYARINIEQIHRNTLSQEQVVVVKLVLFKAIWNIFIASSIQSCTITQYIMQMQNQINQFHLKIKGGTVTISQDGQDGWRTVTGQFCDKIIPILSVKIFPKKHIFLGTCLVPPLKWGLPFRREHIMVVHIVVEMI